MQNNNNNSINTTEQDLEDLYSGSLPLVNDKTNTFNPQYNPQPTFQPNYVNGNNAESLKNNVANVKQFSTAANNLNNEVQNQIPQPNQQYNPNSISDQSFTYQDNYNSPQQVEQTALNDNYIYSDNQAPVTDVAISDTKKRGNKMFYMITGTISLILLLIIGVLGYLIWQSSINNSKNSSLNIASSSINSVSTSESANSEGESAVSVPTQNASFTDPNGTTPLQASRLNDDTTISSVYLEKYFANNLNGDKTCNDENICGISSDSDLDGLINLKEYNYQTNPNSPDTDNDGISDSDEFIYQTNPKEKDSDGDKVSDLEEIIACSDPALKTFSPITLNQSTREKIALNLSKTGLNKVTVDSLVKAGATTEDLKGGFILKSCGKNVVTINK